MSNIILKVNVNLGNEVAKLVDIYRFLAIKYLYDSYDSN